MITMMFRTFGTTGKMLTRNNKKLNGLENPSRFYLVPLGVEINPQFYWGKIKYFSIRKNLRDIMCKGLATALHRINGGFLNEESG